MTAQPSTAESIRADLDSTIDDLPASNWPEDIERLHLLVDDLFEFTRFPKGRISGSQAASIAQKYDAVVKAVEAYCETKGGDEARSFLRAQVEFRQALTELTGSVSDRITDAKSRLTQDLHNHFTPGGN